MHYAVAFNQVDEVQYFIEGLDFDINIKGDGNQTPLMHACIKGFHGSVKYLLEKGADINLIDTGGASALSHAVRKEHTALVLYLIENGADVHTKDFNGCTLLHWAGYKNNLFLF